MLHMFGSAVIPMSSFLSSKVASTSSVGPLLAMYIIGTARKQVCRDLMKLLWSASSGEQSTDVLHQVNSQSVVPRMGMGLVCMYVQEYMYKKLQLEGKNM